MFLLRKVNKSYWNRDSMPDWLTPGDVPAVCLNDLKVDGGNKLSVWMVEEDRSNLDAVIASLGANSDDLDHFDYLLIDLQGVSVAQISMEKSSGHSPHARANALWHSDLINLSAKKLVKLAVIMLESVQSERLLKSELKELLLAGLAAGALDPTRMKQKLLDKLRVA